MSGLFDRLGHRPLAERMRPTRLEDVTGQPALEPGSLLRRALDRSRLPSLLLWGPPGVGKTTIARLLAERASLPFAPFSAVLGGVKEVRELVAAAKARRTAGGEGTLLFVDEIHRFNKAQQDAFLPHVEDGTLVLVGATTENPSFHVNGALLSRCLVVVLEALSDEALIELAGRALSDAERGVASSGLSFAEGALEALVTSCHGDARSLYNRLEVLASVHDPEADALDVAALEEILRTKLVYHDRDGDSHYDLISALHKSVRGGDPQAALYWLARMLAGGEPPLYLARRLIRMAVEDISLADPTALSHAVAAMEAYRFLGSPEGELALANATVYLATAPKSAAVYQAFGAVQKELRDDRPHPVPAALKNAPTALMKSLGMGAGYQYPHDLPEGLADQDYLPEALSGRRWYEPSPFGHEKEVARRMAWWQEVLAARRQAGGEAPRSH